MKLKVRTSFEQVMRDAEHALANLAKWPDSQACHDEADRLIALLRADKATLHPRIYVIVLVNMLTEVMSESEMRDAPTRGMKAAWIKMAELL